MIEVNKRLYMDEHTLEKTEGFEKLTGIIQSLYALLLK
jgi:N-formylglutamate amidohydrolase